MSLHVVPTSTWLPASTTCRPPCNGFFKCWVHHVSGKVVLVTGDDPGWEFRKFTHWMPSSLRHTAFCQWEWRDEDKPSPPETVTA
jgi:hypothetical protein